MGTLIKLWCYDRTYVENLTLFQLITATGDGNIETKTTYEQLREYFGVITTEKLFSYIEECLESKIIFMGFAFQDLVNEIGKRFKLQVEFGPYRGSTILAGYDGLWKLPSGHNIIVETKKSDNFKIILDRLDSYSKSLIVDGKISHDKFSKLIVIGEVKTIKELEYQIRGSGYKDIKLISVKVLMNLLKFIEKTKGKDILNTIYNLLIPQDQIYIDQIVKLIDLQTSTTIPKIDLSSSIGDKDLYAFAAEELSKKLGDDLQRIGSGSKTFYGTKDLKIGLAIVSSKKIKHFNTDRYWFSYYPYHVKKLENFKNKYIALICGSIDNILLLPLEFIEKQKENLPITNKSENKFHYNIKINFKANNRFYLYLQKPESKHMDVTEYKI